MKNFTYKYELVVRIIAVLFVAFFAFVFLTGADFDLIPMIIVSTVLTAVEAVAIYALILGVKKYFINKNIEKKGLDCYGIVRNVNPDYDYIGEFHDRKLDVEIVNPNTLQLEHIIEEVETVEDEFPVNSYVKCKYNNGYINIIEIVDPKDIPGDAKKLLVSDNK